MQRHERFAWTWAAAGALSVLGLHGFEVPPGASPVSFSARGATGGEQATPLEGMGPAVEGFELKVEEVPLTTEPKRYTIGSSRVSDGKRGDGTACTPAPARPNGA
ncbi:hypothetical protein [Archangium violaceum]|uniref:hypothetical protein n=1 Tax=Archangium violaceum TaxID=83451 RepID=UPI0036DC5B1D